MPNRINLAKSDSQLRRRLMLGSITLASLIILIFTFVAYDLAYDLGKSQHRVTFDQQIDAMAKQVNRELAKGREHQKALNGLKKFGNVVVHLQAAKINDSLQPINAQPDENADLFELLNLPPGRHQVGEITYYVNRKQLKPVDTELTLLWSEHHVDALPDFILIRLGVAAFFTFWIAVWAGFVMSAFIAQRFERANNQLRELVLLDELTGLPNRMALMDHHRHPRDKGALFFIDIDRFKEINDAFEHQVGDKLLRAFAQRLQRLVGTSGKVYRYRSDEFVIWMGDLTGADVYNRAFRLLYDCREPLKTGKSFFELGCSIGVASSPAHGKDIESLLSHADAAMQHAKTMRLGVQVFDDSIERNSTLKVMLRNQLRTALKEKQFELYYQPKVAMPSGKIIGAEAIIRWNHPQEGLLSPSLFIDLIEQSGIVHAFTRYTIESAVSQIVAWKESGFALPVSVNLSAYNLMDNALIPYIEALLQNKRFNPDLLEFELTESATMVDIDVTKRMLKAFNALGIRTSLDDFGTGMSSFAYLRELTVQTVKIDRSFVTSIADKPQNLKIVEGLISLCRSLGFTIVAEGVETKEQAATLHELGCEIGQGYLYGPPVPAPALFEMLKSQQRI